MRKESMIIETGHGSRMVNDTDEFPSIEVGNLEDIFLLESLTDEVRDTLWGTYTWNGIPVPRVSNILRECIHKEYLIDWASAVGRKKYLAQKEYALTVGTIVHEIIDRMITERLDIRSINFTERYGEYGATVFRCVKNFENWEIHLSKSGYYIDDVIAVEEPVTTPYYGGTIDAVLRINGGVYIVDFKTSKQISFEYILQTAAYMWAINSGYHKHIPYVDGIGIIRVDKYKERFEDIFLNYNIPEHKVILDQYISGFGSLLMSYYNLKNMELLYKSYHNSYLRNETLGRSINDEQQ